MVSKITETVTGDQVLTVLVILFLIGYFAYKEWPELKERISSRAAKEAVQKTTGKNIAERLTHMENRIGDIDAKLARDYERINELKIESARNRRMVNESLEERQIIMRALLGALGGLQQLGANGPTKKAEAEINEYLNRKAHSAEKKEEITV